MFPVDIHALNILVICSIMFGVTCCKICALILHEPGVFFHLRLLILVLTSLAVTGAIRRYYSSVCWNLFFLLLEVPLCFGCCEVLLFVHFPDQSLYYLLVEFYEFLANNVLRLLLCLLGLFLFCCFDLWLICLLLVHCPWVFFLAARIGWALFRLFRRLGLNVSI